MKSSINSKKNMKPKTINMISIIYFVFVLVANYTINAQSQVGSDIDGETSFDNSGIVSLSADGNIVAIGADLNDGNGTSSGHVRIYKNVTGIWTQIGTDIDGKASGDRSGVSLSLSANGNIVAIGALHNDGNGSNSGHVRVYENQSNIWTQIGDDINGEATGDLSGESVSLSSNGNIVAIGASRNDENGSNSGHVRVYENQSNVWTQIGDDINGETEFDQSGVYVSLSADGNIVAIGADRNDENGSDSGHVRVYENQSNVWTQIGNDIDGAAIEDYSGFSLDLSENGNIVAIGAYGNDANGNRSGHVRVYENQSNVWTQIGSDINGEAADDYSGVSVSLSSDGSILAIGAYFNDGSNGNDSGHVRVYKNQSNVWTQIGSDIDGEAAYDYSGRFVSLSTDGSILAVGATYNDGSNGVNSGHVRVYDVNETLSIQNNLSSLDILIYKSYPNTLSFSNLPMGITNLKLFSTIGQELVNTTFRSSSNQDILLPYVTKGIYVIRLDTEKGIFNKKIILD